MELKTLTKLIRKEDVNLWIGAGFSLYAGYPSGKKLQEVIFQELNPDEQREISITDSLRTTASALVTLRGQSRYDLNRIIKEIFGKPPIATDLHDQLSHIPHFKSIVTTNYDSMIEDSYARRAVVIRNDEDIPHIEHRRTAIYKPHGDLSSLDKLIITKNDYLKLKVKPESPFWFSLIDTLSKKSLLFLGYSFEDENVWAWLDLTDEHLKLNRKQRFLVAPNWPLLKIKELQERGITYINMTADAFLSEVTQELRLNIIADLENGLVSQDTFNQFFNLQDVDIHIRTIDGKPKVEGLSKKGKFLQSTVNFKFSDKKIAQQMHHFNQGIGKSVKFESKQLSSIEFFIQNFKMNMSIDTIQSLKIERIPQKHNLDIEFPDDDFVIEGLTFDSYKKNKKQTIIECKYFGYKIKLTLIYNDKTNAVDIKSEFFKPTKFPSTLKSVFFHKAICYLVKGHSTIFKWNDKIIDNIKPLLHTDTKAFEHTLIHFEKLRRIEQKFLVNFEGAEITFSKYDMQLIDKLILLIEEQYLDLDIEDGITIFTKEDGTKTPIPKLPNHIESIFIRSGKNKTVTLYGKIIDLGEQGLEISNVEYIDFNEENTVAKARSKTGVYKERYSKTFDFASINYID
jgi:hypothetical protein